MPALASRAMPTRPLLAVDRANLLFRAFHALPDSITDDEGRPVNGLLGMANLVLFAIERYAPRAVVLCDGAEAAVYRKELLPAYHAHRPEVPADLARQFAEAEEFFGAFAWTTLVHDTLEADDLLGSLATVETAAGGEALLFTGDRDMFQCAAEHVTVLYPKTGAGKDGPEEIGPDEVRKRYGIPPELVPDFIALRGDPSDGIPGAKGIGEKTARDLLLAHGTLEGAIANAIGERPRVQQALREQAEELRAFKEMATLVEVPVQRPADRPTDFLGGAEMARSRGMNRLSERLEKLAAAA
jgi:5'-3' exonuclease